MRYKMTKMSFIFQSYCQTKKSDLQIANHFFAILCNERSLSAMDIVFEKDKVILNSMMRCRYD